MGIAESPLAVNVRDRDAPRALTNPSGKNTRLSGEKAERPLPAASGFQSSTGNKRQRSGYFAAACVVAMKTVSLGTQLSLASSVAHGIVLVAGFRTGSPGAPAIQEAACG